MAQRAGQCTIRGIHIAFGKVLGMTHVRYGWCFIAALMLGWLPAVADTDDALFGPPESQAVEFASGRHIGPLELLPIQVNGWWGYADRRGDVVIAPRFEWVDYFYGPFAYDASRYGNLNAWVARYRSQGKSGLLVFYQQKNGSTETIKADELDIGRTSGVNPDRYSEGYTVVLRWVNQQPRYQITRDLEFGDINATYAHALRMSEGYAAVQEELCGFIDKRGKVVIPLQFAEVRSFHDGLAAVRQPVSRGNGWGFIDKTGRFRFHDKNGEIQELRSYSEGLAAVKARGKWGFLDKAQRVRIDPIYDEVRDYVDGRAAVRRGDAWGYLDVTGKEIAFGFDGAWDFDTPERSGLAGNSDNALATSLGLIRQGEGFGYIDRAGDIAIQPRYENAMPFFRGVARVKCGDSFAYIGQSGQLVWDPRRVANLGIRGLAMPEAVEPKWPGMPALADAPGVADASGPDEASGEPYPFEYDIVDHLTYGQQGGQDSQNTQDRPPHAQNLPDPQFEQPDSQPEQPDPQPEQRRGSNR